MVEGWCDCESPADRVDLSLTRRQIEERLAELEPDAAGRQGAKPTFKREPLFLRLQLGVLDLFERAARELGPKARLEIIRHDPPAPEMSVRLSPTNPEAARVEAYPGDEDTVYFGLGVAGWVETWIGSGGLDEFLKMLEEYVRAVVRGDLEEVYWRLEGASEQDVTGSKTYLTLKGKHRRVGKIRCLAPYAESRQGSSKLRALLDQARDAESWKVAYPIEKACELPPDGGAERGGEWFAASLPVCPSCPLSGEEIEAPCRTIRRGSSYCAARAR